VEDGTVVIDMANFNSMDVDSTTNVASIGVGNRLGNIVTQLNSAGRALPHGTCAYVGWGGHSSESVRRPYEDDADLPTAMGGYGFTSRMWGLTLDTVEEAEVVLGNGTIVVASQGENSDLLWVRHFSPSTGIYCSNIL
jgi:FAD/FMN-containing dehydrogenase